jgi:hypothetical protein
LDEQRRCKKCLVFILKLTQNINLREAKIYDK